MTLFRKLSNPFALVLQGFVIGGLFFWTTQGASAHNAPAHTPSVVTSTWVQ